MSLVSNIFARRIPFYYRFMSSHGVHAVPQDGTAAEKWRKLTLYVCIPAIALCSVHVYLSEEPERPEFRKYEHLRIRRTKFPWRDGVKTLFHDPHCNALPDGYEDE